MKYNESVRLLSASRINKYKSACGGDKAKTIQLYQYNIKLCQRFYGIMSMFEIMLRNLINEHYLTQFQDANWIINQATVGKLLEHDINDIHKYEREYRAKGVYSHDKMVASFHFGFWTSLFTKRNYRIGNKTLLRIFPNKAHGLNQKDIYEQLTTIREFRNRIAHYEPICFDVNRSISTVYARRLYGLIQTYVIYMGYNPYSVFQGIEKPKSILAKIDKLQNPPSSKS